MNELTTNTEGPELLKVPFSKWPNLSKKKVEVDEEEKELVLSVNLINLEEQLINIDKHNDWRRLLRLTVYIIRISKREQRDDSDNSST